MRNVRIEVAYDGARFFGWQRQDGFASVQQALEEALASFVGQSVTVHGAGRTDTGVHALRQIAHFHVESRLDDERLCRALNANLCAGVLVRRLETCTSTFHSRFDALSKRYLYVTATGPFRPPFGREHCHWTPYALDVGRMRSAARGLIGTHDFRAFGNTGSPRASTVRRILGVRFLVRRERIAFVVQGDGFLYNMVRTIAGTLLDIGRGRLGGDVIASALTSGDRASLGPTAPPEGLYLVSVQYAEALFRAHDARARTTRARSAKESRIADEP